MAMPRFSFLCVLLPAFFAVATFPPEEFESRLTRAQAMMKQEGLDAMFLTMEVHHYYFTGMHSEFWQSPTRPYFIVVPVKGKITAVVPIISGTLYEDCKHTVDKVITWPAPVPEDDGVSALADVLRQLKPGAVVGAELGDEFQMRMPVRDYMRVEKLMKDHVKFQDATRLLQRIRVIKSPAEIELHRNICQRHGNALKKVPGILRAGMTEREAARLVRIELMQQGIDRVPFIACRSDVGGVTEIVGAASDRKLKTGDVLIIDVGSVIDGYFCDFNRNWYVGYEVPAELAKVQEILYNAVDAGIAAARPGANTADVWQAMSDKLPGGGGNVGRAGHSVGMVITEWPSIMSSSKGQNVTLEEGMVFAIEPSFGYGDHGQFLVHEENIVIRKGGAELLSERGPRLMPVIFGGLGRADNISVL